MKKLRGFPLDHADDLVLVADKPDSLNRLLQALNQRCTDNRMCTMYTHLSTYMCKFFFFL